MGKGMSEKDPDQTYLDKVSENKSEYINTNSDKFGEINTGSIGEDFIQNNSNDNILLNHERESNELQEKKKKEQKLEKIKSTDIALQMKGVDLQTQIEENRNVSKGIKKVNDSIEKRQELIDHKRKVFGNKYYEKDDSKEMKRLKASLRSLNTAIVKEREDKEPLLHYTKVIEDAYLDAISQCQHYISVKSTWLGDTRYNMVLNVMKNLTDELSLVSSFKLSQVELTDEEKASVKNGSQILAAATVFNYIGESNKDKNIAVKKNEFYNGRKYDAEAEDAIIQDEGKNAQKLVGTLSDMEKLPAAIAGLIMGVEKPVDFCKKFGEDGRDILFGLYDLLNKMPSNSAHCEYINTATFALSKKRGQRRKFSSDKSHNIMGLMQEKDGTLSLRILVNGDTKLIRLRNDGAGICNSICENILDNEQTFGREFINNRINQIVSKRIPKEKLNSYRDEYLRIIEKRLGISDMTKYAAALRDVSSDELRRILDNVFVQDIETEAEFAAKIGYKSLINSENMDNRAENTEINTPEIIEKTDKAKTESNIDDKVVIKKAEKKVEIVENAGDELIEKEEVDEETLKEIEAEIEVAKKAEREKREAEEKRRIVFEKQSQWSKEEESVKNLIADFIFSKDSVGVDKLNKKETDDTKKKAERIRKVLKDNNQALLAMARHPRLLARFINRLPLPMENNFISEINEKFDELMGGSEELSKGARVLGDGFLISMIEKKIDEKTDEELAEIEDSLNEKILSTAQVVQDKVNSFYNGDKEDDEEDAEEAQEEKNDLSKYCIKVDVDDNTFNGDDYIKWYNDKIDSAKKYFADKKYKAIADEIKSMPIAEERMNKSFSEDIDDNSSEEERMNQSFTEKIKKKPQAEIKEETDEEREERIDREKEMEAFSKKTKIEMPKKIETPEEKSQAIRYIIIANTTVNKHNNDNKTINMDNILKVIKKESRLTNDDLCAELTKGQKQKYGETIINYMCNESMSGDKGQGLFIKKVMNSYFAEVSDMDKRSMFAEAIRNAKPYLRSKAIVEKEMQEEKEKEERKKQKEANKGLLGMFQNFLKDRQEEVKNYEKEDESFTDGEQFVTSEEEAGVENVEKEYLNNLAGNFMSGFIKGAGPLLQKVLQGCPVNSDTNVFIKQALQDVRSKLLPISEEVVKAQLLDMVNKSNGSISKIEVVKSLGAASVGEAFLCKLYGPTELSSGKEVVIKILRPDAQKRMLREKEIMLKCARETNAGMEATYKGQLERVLEELNLEIEASNVKAGAVYDKRMVAGENDHVKAMKLNNSIKATSDYMVVDKAEGATVDNYLSDLEEKINTLLKPFAKFTEDGKTLYRDKNGRISVNINSKNNLKYMKTFYAINDLLRDARNRQEYLVNLGEKWAEEGLFKSGFYHGDLHAGNILISKKEATVIDFGNSTSLSADVKTIITGMLIYAGDSHREGYAEKFVDSYGKLMSPESMDTFTEKRDEFIKVVERIFELGDINETGGRIATVLLRAQEMGLELPAPIYNFSMCQIRISNTINDYNSKLKELENVAETFARAQGREETKDLDKKEEKEEEEEKEKNYGDLVKDAKVNMITNVYDNQEDGAKGLKDKLKRYVLIHSFFTGDFKTYRQDMVQKSFNMFKAELKNVKKNPEQLENFHKIFNIPNYDKDRMALLTECKSTFLKFASGKKLKKEQIDYLRENNNRIGSLFSAYYTDYVNSDDYTQGTDAEKTVKTNIAVLLSEIMNDPIDAVESGEHNYNELKELFKFLEDHKEHVTLSKVIKDEVEKYLNSNLQGEEDENALKTLYLTFYNAVSGLSGKISFDAGFDSFIKALDTCDKATINKNVRTYFTGTEFGPEFKSKIAEYYEVKANNEMDENEKNDQLQKIKAEINVLHIKITALKVENLDKEADKIDKSLRGFGDELETFNDGMSRAVSRHKGDAAKGVGYWESAKIIGRTIIEKIFG